MVLLAIETGLRWAELVALRPCDIDFTARTVIVRRVLVEVAKKNSPTGERCIIKDYVRDTDLLFTSKVGHQPATDDDWAGIAVFTVPPEEAEQIMDADPV